MLQEKLWLNLVASGIVGSITSGPFTEYSESNKTIIKNCTFGGKNSHVVAHNGSDFGARVSGIVSNLNSYGEIIKCKVLDAKVEGGREVGGIAGVVTGASLSDCTVENGIVIGNERVGGIVGGANTTSVLTKCGGTGTVTGKTDTTKAVVGYGSPTIDADTITGSTFTVTINP